MNFFKDLSLSAFTAGFVAVLVGFTSSVAIVFQAAQAFQADAGADHLLDVGPGSGHGPVLGHALTDPARSR
jgi:benzoate membrane transport protein